MCKKRVHVGWKRRNYCASSHLLFLTNRRLFWKMNIGAISLPALRGAYWWPAEGITGGQETGILCPPCWLCSDWLSDGLAIYAGAPEWRQLQNELSPKNLDWWNLVRGLIGLKDRSKRCLYWLDCFFIALESFANFHLMAGLVVQR